MEVFYKEQLLNSNNRVYDTLNDLPVIGNTLITGDLNLEDLDVYTTEEIEQLLKSLQSVHVLDERPADPAPNSMYYIGTESPYKLYLYDGDLNEIYLGESSTETYRVMDPIAMSRDQSLSVKVDNSTVKINDAGELYTSINYEAGKSVEELADGSLKIKLAEESGLAYQTYGERFLELNSNNWGASTTDGEPGVPPRRMFYYNDPISLLGGDGEWHKIIPKYNTGDIKIWPSSNIPDGWLACNGEAVSRDVYKDLYALIGTTYGDGDGVNTFNLPNLIDRIIEGAGTVDEAGRYMDAAMPYVQGEFRCQTNTGHQCGLLIDRVITPNNAYTFPGTSGGIYRANDGHAMENNKGFILDPFLANATYRYQGSDNSKALFPASLNLYYIIKS